MRFWRSVRTARAFTLMELLVVIAIIAILFGLIGVVAYKVRAKARVAHCKALLKRIHVSMDEYHTFWRDYPSGTPGAETWPDPYDVAGVELDRRWLTDREPGARFYKEDLCSKAGHDMYFIDPWANPTLATHKHIRYRKVARNRMLIWSLGPDQIDAIGADTTGKRERIPEADDLSNIESDY